VILGAGNSAYPGWIPTDIDCLNVVRREDWARCFSVDSVDAMLAEHVWEHLAADEALAAARNCHRYLKHGGYARVAVPDGLHPDPAYIRYVAPGGGPNGESMGHLVLYDYRSLSAVFEAAGFKVELLEWFDEAGLFHATDWPAEAGYIERSARFDERNAGGQLRMTSVIIDAVKL
jgi:predicted SAM-dependent methyltransferase